MENSEEQEGAAALIDQEKRCPQCEFINLAEAELCISCAQELLPKEETKKYLVHKRTNVSCRFCTSILAEDYMICPMCSKSQDLPKEAVLQKKCEDENYQPDKPCKFCTTLIKQDSRICPVCSKSQDLPVGREQQEKDTDNLLTDDEDDCPKCTYKTKASKCDMCDTTIRPEPAYVERKCMPERDKTGRKDIPMEQGQNNYNDSDDESESLCMIS